MFTPTPLYLSSLAAVAVQFTIISNCSQDRELTEMGYSWLWLAVNVDYFFPSTPFGVESGYIC